MMQTRNLLQRDAVRKGQDCYSKTNCNYKCNYANYIAKYCCYSELSNKSIYTKIDLHNTTLKYTPSFMLQIKDHHKYYNLVCNKYKTNF